MENIKGKKIYASFLKVLAIIFVALLAVALPIGCGDKDDNNGGGKDYTEYVVPDTPVPEGGARTIFHYYRPDGKYDKWNVYFWTEGAVGVNSPIVGYQTIGGQKWAVAVIDLPSLNVTDAGYMGYLIRKGNTWTKDVEDDRWVPESAIVDGVANIYVISKDANTYCNEQEGLEGMANLSKPHITAASFASLTKINITTDTAITANSHFKVKDAAGDVLVELNCAGATCVGTKRATLELPAGKSVDFSQKYTIVDEPATANASTFVSKRLLMTSLYGSTAFNDAYKYDGELGAIYSKEQTLFRVWSPYATAMKVNIYAAGEGGEATSYDMTKGEKGTWSYTLAGDQNGKYYTYTVLNSNAKTTSEIVDPYARSGGKNGQRGMILDLASTNPEGWDTQQMPQLKSNTQAVIWEAHVRDVTIHESSGVSVANRGKFLGLTETGTKNASGKSTALDYIKELGVTEVHFQPIFDFATVDESFTQATYNKVGEFNWGYDPLNYNMPEGSYSTNPSDGKVRVNELKQMIMALHNAGVQVVMDVVYNHVNSAARSNFEKLVPGYYFRLTDAGTYKNGSGCGNETASEHAMFRKFMVDSVKYWMSEYKLDGFRFDLMALHDIDTMNTIYDELAKINPDVLVYGEGWDAGTNGLSSSNQASLANAKRTPNIAYFDDVIRNALRGDNFNKAGTGYVQGVNGIEEDVYVGVKGATNNFAGNPTQNINYVCAHDDSTLWDRLNASVNYDKATLKAMNRLAATSVYTSQGIAFMLAGEEMLRSKPTTKDNTYDNRPNPYKTNPSYYFSDNSYKSPDSVNAINWNLLDENADMIEYYKALIAIKKTWPQFQLSTKTQVDNCVFVTDNAMDDGIVAYAIKDPNSDEYAVVVLNNSDKSANVSIPNGQYDVFINGAQANATEALSTVTGGTVEIGARSAMVLRGTISGNITDWTYNVSKITAA